MTIDPFSFGAGLLLMLIIFAIALPFLLMNLAKSRAEAAIARAERDEAKNALNSKNDDYMSLLEANSALREQKKALEAAKEELSNHFKVLSQEALNASSEHFMRLAQERFKQWDESHKNEMEKRKTTIDELIKPVSKTLETLNASMEQMKGTDQSLKEELLSLKSETSKIAGAMHNPSARGKWGEYVLERLLERSGLVKDVHFQVQPSLSGEARIQRPDIIIHLQDDLRIVVDSKAPIQDILDDLDEPQKEKELASRLAKQVRSHITDLGKKSYQEKLDSPDFVVLFLPAEHLFSMAIGADPSLIDYAAERNIVLASPILIMSILRVVRMSWQQNELAENAQDIAAAGLEMYNRLGTFADHLSGVGKSLDSAVKNYNKSIGSFERNVLPQARRFEDLHASGNKTIDTIAPIDTQSRDLALIEKKTAGEKG